MSCVIGIDIGTTSTIGVLLDTSKHKILKKISLDVELYSYKEGWAEEDPNQWWSNTKQIIKELSNFAKKKEKEIVSIGTTGMLPALVTLDKNGQVIRKSIQQSDSRTSLQLNKIFNKKNSKNFTKITKCGINQQLIAPKLLWLKENEKNNFKKIYKICGSYDYINYKLTGKLSVEHNWALESGLMDFNKKKFTKKLTNLGFININVLPKIYSSDTVVDKISNKIANELLINKNVKVTAGCADHVVSAFSSGVKKSGDVLLKFGGAGDILVSTKKPLNDERLFLDYHILPKLFMPNGCMASSGSLLNWFIKNIYSTKNKKVNLKSIDNKASKTDIKNNKIVMLPYFLGEKTPIHDLNAKGTITGLNLSHNKYDIWIAVLESVSFGFMHHLEILKENNIKINNILASDGGSKSELWMQITANIIQKPIKIYKNIEGSYLGAAFVSAKTVGLYKNWEDINKLSGDFKIIQPQKKLRDHYKKKYIIYRKLYENLKDLFPLFQDL
mgnify:CR=1 FL=1